MATGKLKIIKSLVVTFFIDSTLLNLNVYAMSLADIILSFLSISCTCTSKMVAKMASVAHKSLCPEHSFKSLITTGSTSTGSLIQHVILSHFVII